MFNPTSNNWVPWLLVVGCGLAASALSLLVALWAPVERSDGLAVGLEGAERIVSLGPSLTETLVALGAGPKLVGTSDYCIAHADLENTRRVGTGLTPNYEAIVGLGPDLIVMERGQQSGGSHLEPLAPTQVLPWLSLEDVLAGVETLGALTQNQEEAAALRARLESRLDVPANPNGVRLLLLFGAPSFEGGDVWYAKRNSLHGAAIHAAGARNAIDRDVSGAPTLSVEELLAQDPDVVILMVPEPELSPEGRMAMVQSFGRLEALRAARDGKIGFLVGAEYMRTGPDILDTVDALQSELARLSKGGG